jgi:aryl-alcohol dehydrogenase-like predicted oxidoreductase
MVISTKAGYWSGMVLMVNWIKEYLIASLDQSLKRMGLTMLIFFIIIARI